MKKLCALITSVMLLAGMGILPAFAANKPIYDITFEDHNVNAAPSIGAPANLVTGASAALVLKEENNQFARISPPENGSGMVIRYIDGARFPSDTDKRSIISFRLRTPDEKGRKDVRMRFSGAGGPSDSPVSIYMLQISDYKLYTRNSASEVNFTNEKMAMEKDKWYSFSIFYDEATKDYSMFCGSDLLETGNFNDLNETIQSKELKILRLDFYSESKYGSVQGVPAEYDVDDIKVVKPEAFTASVENGSKNKNPGKVTVAFTAPVPEEFINADNITVDGVEPGNLSFQYDKDNAKVDINFEPALELGTSYIIRFSNIKNIYQESLATEALAFETAGELTASLESDQGVNPVKATVLFSGQVDMNSVTEESITVSGVAKQDMELEWGEEAGATKADIYFNTPLKFNSTYTIHFSGLKGIFDEDLLTSTLTFKTMANAENVVRKELIDFETGSVANNGDTGIRMWNGDTAQGLVHEVVSERGNKVFKTTVDQTFGTSLDTISRYMPQQGTSIVSFRIKVDRGATAGAFFRSNISGNVTLPILNFVPSSNTLTSLAGKTVFEDPFDKWLAVTVKFDYDNRQMSLYINGEAKFEDTPINNETDFSYRETDIRFTLSRPTAGAVSSYIDDLVCYQLGTTSASVETEQEVDQIQVTFNNPVDPETVSKDTVSLDGIDDYTVVMGDDLKSLTIIPDTMLQYSSEYSVSLSKKITDITGQNVVSGKNYIFQTGEEPEGPSVIRFYENYGTAAEAELSTIKAGTITVAADFVNQKETEKSAYMLVGCYRKDTNEQIYMGGEKVAVDPNTKMTKTFTIEVPDENCYIETLFVKDIANPLPMDLLPGLTTSLK